MYMYIYIDMRYVTLRGSCHPEIYIYSTPSNFRDIPASQNTKFYFHVLKWNPFQV